uniref:Uncharacterized protein n=1 Tax=Acrobeloides nanus TaxID=290746 RepID=A0A914DPB2_9BILA
MTFLKFVSIAILAFCLIAVAISAPVQQGCQGGLQDAQQVKPYDDCYFYYYGYYYSCLDLVSNGQHKGPTGQPHGG